jgi:hypothetical protein
MGVPLLIDIEAVRNESFAIPGNLGFGSGENFSRHLHAEVFVKCREGQIAGGAFDDVLASEKGCFVKGFDTTGRITSIEKFGDHSRNSACGVLIDKFRKGFFGVVSFQDFSDFKGLWQSSQVSSESRNLNTADHVASHHGKQRGGVRAYKRSEPLLKHLEQIALGKVHLEDRMQRGIPAIGFRPHGHGE